MTSTSDNDKSLLIQQKPTKVVYSDKSVDTSEPANGERKKVHENECSQEDIKVSLVVTCCPCPVPAKCEDKDGCCECTKDVSHCECTKDGGQCECTKNGQNGGCCAKKSGSQDDMTYTSAIYSFFGCCTKKAVADDNEPQ